MFSMGSICDPEKSGMLAPKWGEGGAGPVLITAMIVSAVFWVPSHASKNESADSGIIQSRRCTLTAPLKCEL